GNIEIGVAGGEDKDKDTSVENPGKIFNSRELDGDDEWRGSSRIGSRRGEGKLLRVVWHQHTEEKDREAVEEEDTVEGEFDGAWNGLTWVLGFADGDTY